MAGVELGLPETVYERHPSIMTLVFLWSKAHHRQWLIVEAMRTGELGSKEDDEMIDLDYQIEEIDAVLRQLEPLIGA